MGFWTRKEKEKAYIENKLILKSLERSWADPTIMLNPRAYEIQERIVAIADQIGMIDPKDPNYRNMLHARIECIINDNHTVTVEEKTGIVIVTIPPLTSDYQGNTKAESYRYEIIEEGKLKRTWELHQTGQENLSQKVISIFDEYGIEQEQHVQKDEDEYYIQRLAEFPHIIKVIKGMKTQYCDMAQSEHFENIPMKGVLPIAEEHIQKMTLIQTIRILQKIEGSVYEQGIRKLLGIPKEIEKKRRERE